MNFHFVDQILELIPGQKAVGLKHVTPADFYLTNDRVQQKPVLISCIVGEAIGQLCSWNVIKATDGRRRSVAGIVSAVKVYGQAELGDTILLEVTIEQLEDDAVTWHGRASVRGQVIVEVLSSVGPCLPMENFNEISEVLQHLQIIERPQVKREAVLGVAIPIIHFHDAAPYVQYDQIIDKQPGLHLTALKNVSMLAPYFKDHFPRKPVLPVSILLECNLQLGQIFLKDLCSDKNALFIPRQVSRIKISEFIQPGDTFITHVSLKQQSENAISLQFKSEINGKRFCVCEAEFIRYST